MAGLTKNQIEIITSEFYSCFCGINLSEAVSGVFFVCSDSRNDEVKGFGCKYSIYTLVKEDAYIVSYAPQYADFFEKLRGESVANILRAI